MENLEHQDPVTLKLSLREKIAYGMGDFGSNLYCVSARCIC